MEFIQEKYQLTVEYTADPTGERLYAVQYESENTGLISQSSSLTGKPNSGAAHLQESARCGLPHSKFARSQPT